MVKKLTERKVNCVAFVQETGRLMSIICLQHDEMLGVKWPSSDWHSDIAIQQIDDDM